jgi:hypothetical protein
MFNFILTYRKNTNKQQKTRLFRRVLYEEIIN